MKRLFYLLSVLLLLGCISEPMQTTPVEDLHTDALGYEVSEVTLAIPSSEPTAAPTSTPMPSPTPMPEPTPTPVPEPFTLVWMSDSQNMIAVTRMQDRYLSICDWIADEADTRNFKMFLHTGDMVDNGDNNSQWRLFQKGLDKITAKMPCFWSTGNHDEGYQKKRPWKEQPFVKELPEEQKLHGGAAAWTILEVGETKLLLISVCYWSASGENTAQWLCDVCAAHSELPVILLSHSYLTAEGSLTALGAALEKNIVRKTPNLRLVLCGHARGITRQTFAYDDDGDGTKERTVHALMYDIQSALEESGYICLLTYDPATDTLTVTSYNPALDDEIFDDEQPETERFTIKHLFY